jgi:hypothetical protein
MPSVRSTRIILIKVMKDIKLPEFGIPSEYINIRDVLKMYVEQDSLWTEEWAKVVDVRPIQVQQFIEHPIRAKPCCNS